MSAPEPGDEPKGQLPLPRPQRQAAPPTEESVQRVVQIRVHSLVGCSVPAGQVLVKVRLGSASEEVLELQTPEFPMVNGVCWMESWLRIPTEATWAELEVIRTRISSFGYSFRALHKSLGSCHFYLPHPYEGWVQDSLPLIGFSVFQELAGPDSESESADSLRDADFTQSESASAPPGPVSEALEEGHPHPQQQQPQPSHSRPQQLRAPPPVASTLRRTTSIQLASSLKRQLSSAVHQGEEFYHQLRSRFKVDTGARLVINSRVLEARASPSLEVENEIRILDRRMHSYAHGGFMGSAISLMADPYWQEVLQEMEPANAKRCMQLASDKNVSERGRMKLMAFLENSPVLCVYGLARSGCVKDTMSRGVGPADVKLEAIGADERKSELPSHKGHGGECVDQCKPIALEWDLWIDPKSPQRLDLATIDHGSAAALVQQAVLKVAGCTSIAGNVGQRHISREGMSPPRWLTILGEVINQAAHGSKTQPLEVPGSVASRHRSVRVRVAVLGLTSSNPQSNAVAVEELRVSVKVDNNPWRLPAAKATGPASVPWDDAQLTLWPLDCSIVNDGTLTVKAKRRGEGSRAIWRSCSSTSFSLQSLTPAKSSSAASASNSASEGQVEPRSWEGEIELDGNTSLRVRISLQGVSAMDAYQELGVPPQAAQSCLVMLSDPGGLYLDVKSAYSTADQVETLAATLTSLGIKTQAACSFVPAQLPLTLPTVLFFHGLSGLENACDDRKVIPGQQVLFNGASFLRDIYENPESLSDGLGVQAKDYSQNDAPSVPPGLVNAVAFTRYQALVALYGFRGGIYIQEPDCSSACADALTWLVNTHPEHFPLGFAYGHVAGVSLGYVSLTGRGFAAQQLLEELEARRRLSHKVAARIDNLEHRKEPLAVTKAWADRLLHGHQILTKREQKLLLQLLSDVQPASELVGVVASLGGVPHVFTRFLLHYEAQTPFSQQETGFDWNYTKPLLRLLRDRGALAALTAVEKVQLALFLASPAAYGKGLQYWLQRTGFRSSLHKLAKEGLACLWESSTSTECRVMSDAIGGERVLKLMLNGHLCLSWAYWRRVEDVARLHSQGESSADSLLFSTSGFRYSALEDRRGGTLLDLKHIRMTRNVSLGERLAKHTRRLLSCMITCGCLTWACLCSCGCSSVLMLRMCLPWCDNRCCSAAAVCGFAITGVLATFLTIVLLFVASLLLNPSFSAILTLESFLTEGSVGVFTLDLTPVGLIG